MTKKLFYKTQGQGKAIVLLHGFMEDQTMWESIETELSNAYKIIRIDLPGHGSSPNFDSVHTMDFMAEQVKNTLDELSVIQATFIGHSMGGYVSLAFAEKYSKNVDGLVLFHSTALADSEEKKEMRLKAIEAVQKNQNDFTRLIIPNLFSDGFKKSKRKQKKSKRKQVEETIRTAQTTSLEGICAALHGMRARPDRTHVFQYPFSKLLIWGMLDSLISKEDIKKQTLKATHTKTVELPVAHMGHLEAPEEVVKALKQFLKSNGIKNQTELNLANGKSVVFYNVENLFDTLDDPHTQDDAFTPLTTKEWNQEKYFTKIDQLGKAMMAINNGFPVIIGLAEIENRDVLIDLIYSDRLKDGNYAIVHQDSPDERGIDVGFICQKDFFDVLSFESITIHFPFDEDDYTRDILYVKGKFKDDDVFHFFVNHWPSRRGGKEITERKRIYAAKQLRNKTNEILQIDLNAKIFIMGDFNDHPTDKSILEALKANNDVSFRSNLFFNLAYDLHVRNKGSHSYRGDWAMLDQMMVSPSILQGKGLTVNPKGLKTLWKKWLLVKHPRYKNYSPKKTYVRDKYTGGFSDHLPIHITLRDL